MYKYKLLYIFNTYYTKCIFFLEYTKYPLYTQPDLECS